MKHDALHAMWRETLQGRFETGVDAIDTPFDIPHFRVEPGRLVEVAQYLKEQGFDMLLDLGGVDYLPKSPRFEVVYLLMRMGDRTRLCLRCSPEDESPELPSLSALWPSANPAEREVFDLFGIHFTDHPNLTRIMMPDDWEGYPLRKDYPLKGDREHTWAPFPADKTRFHAPRRDDERS